MQVNPKIIMKTTLKILLTALACFSLTALAQDQNVKWQGHFGITDFTNDTPWLRDDGTRAAPDSTTWVRIGDYHTPSNMPILSTNTAFTVKSLFVGFGSNGYGELTMSDGSITVNDSFGIGNFNDASGTVNQSGGSMNLNGASHYIGGSSSSTGNGTYNLSGGTLAHSGTGIGQVRFYMGAGGVTSNLNISGTGNISDGKTRLMLSNGGTANISLTGSDTTIGFENWYMGNGTTNLNLTADADGLSLTNINWWEDTGGTQNLVVDLTNYDVANGDSIDIIDVTWAAFDASIWESATIIGKDAEFAYTADGNGTVLSVVNIVPEPSTYALIAGMIGLVAVMLRRR